MDFGVMDTTTCTPMNNTFVEIWHGKLHCDPQPCTVHDRNLPLANATGFYGGYETNDFDSSETFLRGGWYTDSNGVVEVTTVYPGYYDGRTPHVHIMVHKDWTESANGFVYSAHLIFVNMK